MVINEFGELGVDNDLVVDTDEEVFEMNNGCICCTVRGDLIRIVGGLMKRRDRFDGIIIETTGLANPAPVAQTFFVDEGVRSKARLDAIVTVVDAKHLPQRLEDSHEAADQIAFADVIVLNKTDLVSPDELAEVENKIRAINRFATIHRTERAALPIDQVLNRGAFDLNRVLQMAPDFLTDDEHEHNDDVDVGQLRGGEADRPGEVQRLDRRAAAGTGAGSAAHQGHPVLCERRPPLCLPGGAHDRRRRLHRPLEGRRAAHQPHRVHRPQPQPAAIAARVRRLCGRVIG